APVAGGAAARPCWPGRGAGVAGRARQQCLAGLVAAVAGRHAVGGLVGTAALPVANAGRAPLAATRPWAGPAALPHAYAQGAHRHGLTFDTGAAPVIHASVPRLMTAWSCNVTIRFRLPAGRHDDRCLGGYRRGR